MSVKVVNIDTLEWDTDEHGEFAFSRKQIARMAGGEKLGASLYKLMPGKKAFPFHFHHANEEAIFVLEGAGSLRTNDEMKAIKKGDYVAMLIGPQHAHQVINTSDAPLIYLCFSTMQHPDVSEYPDSKKIGISAGAAPGASKERFLLKGYYEKDSHVDYFTNEE